MNVETARVADQTKGAMQGRMRLMWWRDAVEAATSPSLAAPSALPASFRTPVVVALAGVWRQRREMGQNLDPRWLLRSIDARVSGGRASQPSSAQPF